MGRGSFRSRGGSQGLKKQPAARRATQGDDEYYFSAEQDGDQEYQGNKYFDIDFDIKYFDIEVTTNMSNL